MWKDKDGKTLYEKYPGEFKSGGLVNVGSCLSNCHITGACIKVANVFAKLPLRGNYEEVADYILNKVGAVGLAWGAMSQKAAAIATGVNRWGIPVIVGPHSTKYRRMYLSDGNDFEVFDKKANKIIKIDPTPEHLITPAENLAECMCAIPKLCMRPNDGAKGRSMKLYHYISVYEKYLGCMPPDLEKFVRTEKDIPLMMKNKVLEYLKEKGWKPREELPKEPTLLY
jgi:acetyl-CoA decarbonylase/synthase complex subunit alpha